MKNSAPTFPFLIRLLPLHGLKAPAVSGSLAGSCEDVSLRRVMMGWGEACVRGEDGNVISNGDCKHTVQWKKHAHKNHVLAIESYALHA